MPISVRAIVSYSLEAIGPRQQSYDLPDSHMVRITLGPQEETRIKNAFKYLDERDSDGTNGFIWKDHIAFLIHTFSRRPVDVDRVLTEMSPDPETGMISYQGFMEGLTELDRATRTEVIECLENVTCLQQLQICPPPIYLCLIALVNTACFLSYVRHIYESEEDSAYQEGISWHGPVPWCSRFVYIPSRRWEVWRFFTYAFVHAGYGHFLVNTAYLFITGWTLENNHDGWRVLVIYVSGIFAGSLGVSVLDRTFSLTGASAGIYALATANLACLTLNWDAFKYLARQRLTHWSRGWKLTYGFSLSWIRLLLILLLVAWDTYHSFKKRFATADADARLNSHTSHFSAMFVGYLVGVLVLNHKIPPKRIPAWKLYLRRYISPLILAILLIFAIYQHEHTAFPCPDYSDYSKNHTHCEKLAATSTTNDSNCSFDPSKQYFGWFLYR